ncbi:hypothetical protein [Exiguobacterium sp. H66]|uniref:hypothetical protein n=1 Tax=Exiguobacterium sp. H66 TaxID=2751208 RepID=UPI001BE7CB1D|nr:hypothetical protein [Exiguobacterium sp. H66]
MVVVQKGPTCGIYAFLNGIRTLFSLNKLTSDEMDKIVLMLLNKNELTYGNKDEKGKTFVGEFFTVGDFLVFLENNYDYIIKEIHKVTEQKISFNVEECSIKNLNNSMEGLFICSISPKKLTFIKRLWLPWAKWDRNKNVLHWVSFLSTNDDEFNVMDSRYKEKQRIKKEEILSKHNDLNGKKYYWRKFNRKTSGKDKIDEFLCCKMPQKKYFIKYKVLKDVEYQTGKLIRIQKND